MELEGLFLKSLGGDGWVLGNMVNSRAFFIFWEEDSKTIIPCRLNWQAIEVYGYLDKRKYYRLE